ncbi:hypothetical protein B0H67DRAFT_565143, partial [Lasiosphaeris hirsuta]
MGTRNTNTSGTIETKQSRGQRRCRDMEILARGTDRPFSSHGSGLRPVRVCSHPTARCNVQSPDREQCHPIKTDSQPMKQWEIYILVRHRDLMTAVARSRRSPSHCQVIMMPPCLLSYRMVRYDKPAGPPASDLPQIFPSASILMDATSLLPQGAIHLIFSRIVGRVEESPKLPRILPIALRIAHTASGPRVPQSPSFTQRLLVTPRNGPSIPIPSGWSNVVSPSVHRLSISVGTAWAC